MGTLSSTCRCLQSNSALFSVAYMSWFIYLAIDTNLTPSSQCNSITVCHFRCIYWLQYQV